MQGLRKFEVYNGSQGVGDVRTASFYVKIPKSSDVPTRVNSVLPGRFVVQAVAGDSALGDGASAADSTGTPGRLWLGLCVTVTDTRARRLDKQIITPSQEGLALLVPVKIATFAGLEDGVGGGITDAGGFAAITLGTISGEMPEETPYYTPYPNDEIDSSTITSGTAENRALRLIRPVGDITNTDTARRVWQFAVTPAFSADI